MLNLLHSAGSLLQFASCCGILQNTTVQEAVDVVKDNLEPMILQIDGQYYIKVDNEAIPVYEPSCFVEAVDFLLYVFIS